MQQCLGLVGSVVVAIQFGRQRLAAVQRTQLRHHTEVGFALKAFYLVLAFHNQPHRHALHSTGTQRGLNLAPQYGANLVSHQPVQHTTRLLCIHQVHVYLARMLDGVQYGRLCDFVEHDALRRLGLQLQRLLQVPCNGLSLAVFIGRQPHHLGFVHGFFQFAHQCTFVVANLVLWLVASRHVDAHLLLGQVSDVAVARLDGVVLAQELFYCLRLGGRLYNH